jgi:hypothetical protein
MFLFATVMIAEDCMCTNSRSLYLRNVQLMTFHGQLSNGIWPHPSVVYSSSRRVTGQISVKEQIWFGSELKMVCDTQYLHNFVVL